MAEGLRGPVSIAVDTQNIYVSNNGDPHDGSIVQIPLAGGPSITIATGQIFLGSIAVDSANVYWTVTDDSLSLGTLMKAPIGGGAATVLATGWAPLLDNFDCGTTARTLAVDSSNVYFSVGSTKTSAPSLRRISKTGGSAITIADLARPGDLISGVGVFAIDAVNAYYRFPYTETINAVSLDGGTPTETAHEWVSMTDIVADQKQIVWISGDTIRSMQL